MLFRPMSLDDADLVADAACEIIRDDPAAPLTMRAIARARRVTPATLAKRYGSTDALLDEVFCRMSRRWIQGAQRLWEVARHYEPDETLHGITALLPDRVDSTPWVPDLQRRDSPVEMSVEYLRCWLVFRERCRHRPEHERWAHVTLEAEHEMVVASLGDLGLHDFSDALVVGSVIDGLRTRLTEVRSSLGPAEADAALRRCVTRLRAGASEPEPVG